MQAKDKYLLEKWKQEEATKRGENEWMLATVAEKIVGESKSHKKKKKKKKKSVGLQYELYLNK